MSTHRSPQCGNHAGVASWSLLLSSRRLGSGLGLHRPSQGKDLSGSWKQRAPGSWAGVPRPAFLGGTVPQELRAPFQRPDLDGFNSRAFLRKCLSWQQLQPTRARLWLTSPARAGGEGAERGRAGWGLAGSQAIPRS